MWGKLWILQDITGQLKGLLTGVNSVLCICLQFRFCALYYHCYANSLHGDGKKLDYIKFMKSFIISVCQVFWE